jgi:glycosyltransferase involved in cell wall biosynthesis
LFVGRYIPEKGIETLATAYRQYRERVAEPWPLICAGTGPLRGMLVKCGANDVGFVQPKDLPAVMGKAAAFILPSLFEPWGVVLQEAAAAGLPLIATRACGAAVHLLRDGWNGYACEPGCAASLADAMVSMHETDVRSRQAMGLAASDLAAQYSPQLWANTLIHGVGRMRR